MVENLFDSFYNGRNVFITGHTGFKGSWLSILLHRLGANVYGYALDPPTIPSLYNLANVDKLVSSTIGDIRDYKLLLETIKKVKPEIVIHMAAQPLVKESYRNPRETYEINVMGTVNLLDAVRQVAGVKVVLNVTSDKCYENKEWLWPYRENEPLGGHDPYSSSKACSEIITASYRNSFFNIANYDQHHLAIATARAGNVIGGGDWASDRLIPDFIRAILDQKVIKIRNPESIRPWQHVLEPLTGYLLLSEQLYNNGVSFAESWNFGPNDEDAKSVRWIVEKLCEMYGNGAAYELDKNAHHHEATYLKLDCSKAKEKLRWHPRWNLNKALESIIYFAEAYKRKDDLWALCMTCLLYTS